MRKRKEIPTMDMDKLRSLVKPDLPIRFSEYGVQDTRRNLVVDAIASVDYRGVVSLVNFQLIRRKSDGEIFVRLVGLSTADYYHFGPAGYDLKRKILETLAPEQKGAVGAEED